MEQRDYYQILGLHRDATEDEIKKAYRRLALQYHPDHHPDDSKSEEKFKEIGEAYAVLSDVEKKRVYDRFGHREFTRRVTREDVFKDFNFEECFREFGFDVEKFVLRKSFCGKRGRGCGRWRTAFSHRGFFEAYAHDPFYKRESEPIYDLPLTPQEALYGTEKEIVVGTGFRQKRYAIQIPAGVGPNTRLSLPLEELGQEEIQFRVKII